MSEKLTVLTGSDATGLVGRWVKYVFLGGAAGLLIGLVTLFVVTLLYAEGLGLSLAECTAIDCALTLLLSQPVGLAGMIVGATVGALAGAVVHYVRHFAQG